MFLIEKKVPWLELCNSCFITVFRVTRWLMLSSEKQSRLGKPNPGPTIQL